MKAGPSVHTESEVWKPVVGFEGHYAVSDRGRIMRTSGATGGKIVTPSIDRKGYLNIRLSKDDCRISRGVHRVVAMAFVGPCPKGRQANHKNGVKTDNRAENLEWVTPRENTAHSIKILEKSRTGESNANAKLTEDQVRSLLADSRTAPRGWVRCKAMELGVTDRLVYSILRGKRWRHLGATA